jgi:midasin (ATPase involved in ribosome maturation)
MQATPYAMTPQSFRLSDLQIDRSAASCLPVNLALHPAMIDSLEARLACAQVHWLCRLVGSTATGKSLLVRTTADLVGRTFVELSMHALTATTELLGRFE